MRYVNGDRVEIVRNDGYWGEKPPFGKVTFRIIKNEPARMAALLSGDVDAIELRLAEAAAAQTAFTSDAAQHLLALQTLGPLAIHRRSFSPVARAWQRQADAA